MIIHYLNNSIRIIKRFEISIVKFIIKNIHFIDNISKKMIYNHAMKFLIGGANHEKTLNDFSFCFFICWVC